MARSLQEAVLVFTPGAPIKAKDFFRGRVEQLNRTLKAIPAPGIHPVIFGQRGVGKTSLANIVSNVLPDQLAVRVSCSATDDFTAIWDRVLSQASVPFKEEAFGFSPEQVTEHVSLAMLLPNADKIGPAEVHKVLSTLKQKAIFIIDEFDRVADDGAIRSMADLVKSVSDSLPDVTLVLVGVGDSISELIAEHESIVRNLRQIQLPKMSDDEIKAILSEGFSELGIECSERLIDDSIVLCDGFPHYAHLLGQSVATVLEVDGTLKVSGNVFERACAVAVDDAAETLNAAYSTAVATAKKSKYPKILQACGLAEHDERGVFRATEVAEAASVLTGENITIPAVTPALGAFASSERGEVLETISVSGRNQYRFRDPMMRPFLKLKAKANP